MPERIEWLHEGDRPESLGSNGSHGRRRRSGAGPSIGGGACAAVLMTALAGGPAQASSSFGISARPEAVIFEPGPPETAERVQILGLVALAPTMPSATVDFGPPTCGYMYFKCASGEEDLCREQWQEIAAAKAAGKCVMFSARRDSMGALIDQGRVRPFSEAPTAPGTFVATQGLGVSTIPCAGDLTAACSIPSGGSGGAGGGAGAGGAGRSGGAGGGAAGGPGGSPASASGGAAGGGAPGAAGRGGLGGAPGTGGASSAGGTSGSAGGGAGVGGAHASSSGGAGGTPVTGSGGASGSGGTTTAHDAGTDAPSGGKGGGCSLTGETGASASLLGLLAGSALAIAWSRARRREARARGHHQGRGA